MEQVAYLLVEAGPDKGRRIAVTAKSGHVGRDADCEIRLSDPKTSRRHCRLFVRSGELWVVDLISANETLVNEKSIKESRLHKGDSVTLGETVLRVLSEPETHSNLQLKDEPSPDEEHASPVRKKSPLTQTLRAVLWILLILWLAFLTYSLLLAPDTQETPPPAGRQTLVPQDKHDETEPEEPLSALLYGLTEIMIAGDFKSAAYLIEEEKKYEHSEDTAGRLNQISEFVQRVAGMDKAVALLLRNHLGEELIMRREGKEATLVPRAVSGTLVSATLTRESRAKTVTVPVNSIPPLDRSRWLGESASPVTNAMKYVLHMQGGDLDGAERAANQSGLFSRAFLQVLDEERAKTAQGGQWDGK